jgi:hypothetical protein
MELMVSFKAFPLFHGEYVSVTIKQTECLNPDPLRALWRKDKYPVHAGIELCFLGRRVRSLPSSKSALMRYTCNYALSSSH